jgi:hypothetical protein
MSSIQALNVNHPEHHENLNEIKYQAIRDAILSVLAEHSKQAGMPFSDLEIQVKQYLIKNHISMEMFPKPGSIRWYTKAVQLDLEARKIIERVPGQTPLQLRLVLKKK